MRAAYKVWSGIAAVVFCLVAVTDLSSGGSTTTSAASAPVASRAPSTTAPPPTTTTATPTGEPAPSGDTVTVRQVLSGDTFVADGRKVRVLGIDSCPAPTYGGKQAISLAESMLAGQQVILRSEPGIEKDGDGQLLRHVDLSYGTDYGRLMVAYDHTGVEDNGAGDAVLDELREADPNGRSCAEPDYSSSGTVTDDDGGSVNWPSPGDQGLPDGALTGGYCARKWWC